MKTKENRIVKYNHDTYKPEGTYSGELHPTLHFAKPETIVSFISEAIIRKDHDVRFFGPYHYWDVVNRIIMSEYTGCGRDINIEYLVDAVKTVAKIWDRIQFLNRVITTHREYYEEKYEIDSVTCYGKKFGRLQNVGSNKLIGVGKLTADYTDSDPDPYETAGGYRKWRALKGSTVEYYLNSDLTIRLEFKSNCEVDHYNNNFFGNSTGGGTTKYEVGERVAVRSANIDKETFFQSFAAIKVKLLWLDYAKIKEMIATIQPELYAAVNA
tara:strand:+ start:467 stop:1273 length:807 start_codon:yes stop_codon:yes gene_type:complete